MKFTCLTENLFKGLSTVNKAVATRASLPVLSNVLISDDSGRLKLSATNLETAITTWVGASIDEGGSVCIPARVLHEFVSNLPPSSVTGESDGVALKLVSDKVSGRFNGMDATEFPSLPEASKEIHLSIDPKSFSDAIMESAFAAASDESRPVLTGLLMRLEKNILYLVGVDGFRLAERLINLTDHKGKKGFSAVIPAKTILEVARLISTSKEPLNVSLNEDENLVVFQVGDVLISSRVLDGEFPEYKKLIPASKDAFVRVRVSTNELVNALRLANVFAKDAVSVIKLRISNSDGVVYISSSNSEVGENSSKVEAEVTGSDIEAAFNSKYFLDVLSNVKSDEFIFECPEKIGSGVPGVLRPSNRSDHTYLIMPMQY